MTDLIRGFLLHVGKEGTARTCLADPSLGNHYRRVPSADGKLEAWFFFHLKIVKDRKPIPLTGADLLRGITDPVLTPEHSCALLRR